MEAPIKYAKSGDVHIAYRIFGEGPRDLVLIPGTLSHVELTWEFPAQESLLKRLHLLCPRNRLRQARSGSFRSSRRQTLDERIGDVRAVMDAAGSKCATIYGWSEGGLMSLMFAATYPERTFGLVLYGTFASMKAGPWILSPEQMLQRLKLREEHWGEGVLIAANCPSQAKNEAFVRAAARLERASASPASIVTLSRANHELDVLHVLSSIHVPTLILHRKGDSMVPVACGRYLAEHIPGANSLEVPGEDHFQSPISRRKTSSPMR